jgi:hypothetical protein
MLIRNKVYMVILLVVAFAFSGPAVVPSTLAAKQEKSSAHLAPSLGKARGTSNESGTRAARI